MKFNAKTSLVVLLIALFFPCVVMGQLTAVSDDVVSTAYSSGSQDQIYIFCAAPDENAGQLTATSSTAVAAGFEWFKYNPGTGSFDAYQSDNSGAASSTISNLESGCYRVEVTFGETTELYTAWVMNSWYAATAEITESTCDYFQIQAAFDEASSVYYDLATGSELQVFKDVKVRWEADGEPVASVLSPQVFSPPARNTEYKLTVYDRFGCQVKVPVSYQSIVTEASFDATPLEGEAPLEVLFTSTSLNADGYEWFFFRDRDELIQEGLDGGVVEDSILATAIDENPVFIYENSGTYQVKLVTTKNSENFACTDTFYLEDYIVVQNSLLEVANVFTPNGDGVNDVFVVKYRSIKSINIQVFNRWGRKVHTWENNNVQGFEETSSESVWDGRIGGRYASPGVYYYVVRAEGRDGETQNAHGFVHLFREK
ncbi:gliding motility-associated C-terminal domain-containing protein [uncultured Sunxiuqinia sp.]|uniref:gliding motility-associated C-terminal domain-containing protein n=1 Tax=uncultured Sunxiuqinia sp. TaxID=1573825 RepID=UPI002634F61C|nr:gliding motility-associated C-terminal domain-containing protein [uncultured Sunxiuqinia sp.]